MDKTIENLPERTYLNEKSRKLSIKKIAKKI